MRRGLSCDISGGLRLGNASSSFASDDGKQVCCVGRRMPPGLEADERPAQPGEQENVDGDQETYDDDADGDDGHVVGWRRRRHDATPTVAGRTASFVADTDAVVGVAAAEPVYRTALYRHVTRATQHTCMYTYAADPGRYTNDKQAVRPVVRVRHSMPTPPANDNSHPEVSAWRS